MIRVKKVTKRYGCKVVLEDFSCDFPETGFVALTGPSGIGKTTLLHLLLGIQSPTKGTIEIPEGTTFSAVFQENRLLEQESALVNAALFFEGKTQNGTSLYPEGKSTAEQILRELGLTEDIHTKVSELSGGMARRVAIARALAAMTTPCGADVCVMDEPVKGLDEENRKQTIAVIHKYCEGKLLILVTHNEEDAEGADKIISL